MALVPRIEVTNLDPVPGGAQVSISVPETRQPNLSFGVVSRNYLVFVPDSILDRLKGILFSSE